MKKLLILLFDIFVIAFAALIIMVSGFNIYAINAVNYNNLTTISSSYLQFIFWANIVLLVMAILVAIWGIVNLCLRSTSSKIEDETVDATVVKPVAKIKTKNNTEMETLPAVVAPKTGGLRYVVG